MRERIRQKTFKVILPYGVAIGTVPGGQSATGSADRADPRSLSVKAGCIAAEPPLRAYDRPPAAAAEPQLPLLPAPTLPDGGSVLDAPSVAAMLAKAFAPLSSAGEELLPGEMSVSSLSHGPGLVPGTGVPRSGFHPYSFRRPAARVRLFAVSMPRTRSDQHAHRASPIEYRASCTLHVHAQICGIADFAERLQGLVSDAPPWLEVRLVDLPGHGRRTVKNSTGGLCKCAFQQQGVVGAAGDASIVDYVSHQLDELVDSLTNELWPLIVAPDGSHFPGGFVPYALYGRLSLNRLSRLPCAPTVVPLRPANRLTERAACPGLASRLAPS